MTDNQPISTDQAREMILKDMNPLVEAYMATQVQDTGDSSKGALISYAVVGEYQTTDLSENGESVIMLIKPPAQSWVSTIGLLKIVAGRY